MNKLRLESWFKWLSTSLVSVRTISNTSTTTKNKTKKAQKLKIVGKSEGNKN
jgi:hypothetical protein